MKKLKINDINDIKDLKDTVDLMLSSDPFDRLLAEYLQIKIRLDKLEGYFIEKFNHDSDTDGIDTDGEILDQIKSMREYKNSLYERLAPEIEILGLDIS